MIAISLDSGKIAAVQEPVKAIIVDSTWAGVSFANRTFGGRAIIATSMVPSEVVVKMTQARSGIPKLKFSLKINRMSKKEAVIAVSRAIVIIFLGSVNIKNRL